MFVRRWLTLAKPEYCAIGMYRLTLATDPCSTEHCGPDSCTRACTVQASLHMYTDLYVLFCELHNGITLHNGISLRNGTSLITAQHSLYHSIVLCSGTKLTWPDLKSGPLEAGKPFSFGGVLLIAPAPERYTATAIARPATSAAVDNLTACKAWDLHIRTRRPWLRQHTTRGWNA